MRAVNLIPSEQRGGAPVGAGKSGGVAFAVLGVLAAAAVLAGLYGLAKHQVSSRQSEVASLEAKAAQAQAAAAQLAPYTSFIALHQARQQAVEALVDSRFDWAHTFHEFGRVLPRDASLLTLSGSIGAKAASTSSTAGAAPTAAPAATSVTPPGSIPAFTVTGCATTQDAVAEAIDRLRLIDGVSSVSLVSSTKPTSGAGGGGGAGGCASAAAFSLQINFQPLPAASAAAAAATTRTVAAGSGAGATVPAADTAAAGSTGAVR